MNDQRFDVLNITNGPIIIKTLKKKKIEFRGMTIFTHKFVNFQKWELFCSVIG